MFSHCRKPHDEPDEPLLDELSLDERLRDDELSLHERLRDDEDRSRRPDELAKNFAAIRMNFAISFDVLCDLRDLLRSRRASWWRPVCFRFLSRLRLSEPRCWCGFQSLSLMI